MIVKELIAKLGLEIDESSFAVGEGLLGGLTKGALAFGAVASGVAVAVAGMVKATADAGDGARKLAQRVGVDSKVIQEFGYAAALSDVSTEELAVGLQHLAKTGVKDTRGELLRLADQFEKMPDGPEKTALAMAKFGRSGARLIPMLNGGRKSMADLAEEANNLGVVISEDDQKASEEFNDQLTRLQKTFTGARNRIFTGLIRPLTTLTVKLRESAATVLDWVNRGKNLEGILTVLATAFTVLGVAAAVASAKVIAGWLLAAAPFIAIGAAVVLAGLLIQDLLMYLGNDGETLIGKFVQYYKDEFGSLKALTSSVVDFMRFELGEFFKWISGSKIFSFLDPITRAISGYQGSRNPADLVKGFASPDSTFDPVSGQMLTGSVFPTQAQANTATVNAPMNFVINTQPGQNGEDIAKTVGDHIAQQWRQASGSIF